MGRSWRDLDRILRGEATHPSVLGRGTIDLPVGGLSLTLIVLGMVYGACMGSFALFKTGGPSYWQLVASTIKVPLLFVLTLVVTLPSLYVFNALVGSRLAPGAVFRLLVAALAVIMAVLASWGPIVALFSISTHSYPFMLLANVVVFAISGTLGLSFLLQTLHRLSVAPRTSAEIVHVTEHPEKDGGTTTGALDPMEGQVLGRHVKTVFRCWMILFGLVGAQMGWVLRPFLGSPNVPFTWFRGRDSNFFQAVLNALSGLLS